MTVSVLFIAILLTYLGARVCFRDWRKTGARLAHFCDGFLRQSAPVFFIPLGGKKLAQLAQNRRTSKFHGNTGAKETGAMITFETIPDVGTVVILDRQKYKLVGSRPYTRADDSRTLLLVWETKCATCKTEFEVLSPRHAGPSTRRCAEHRKAGKPVKGKRGRRVSVEVVEP
jgi:hypothetical protein